MATRRIRRTYAPQYDRHNPVEPYYPQYPPQPMPHRAGPIDWLLLLICVVIGAAVLSSWLGIDVRQYVSAPPAVPTVHAVVPPNAPQAPPQTAPQAVEAPAPAQPIDAAPAVDAPAPAQSVPTAAVIVAPQPAPVVVVPQAPARIAVESQAAPTAAPAPTVAVTAPMVAGKDFQAPNKTCVETQRKGAAVHFEQKQDLTPAEMSSVADYLRTGMIAGEVGPCAAH